MNPELFNLLAATGGGFIAVQIYKFAAQGFAAMTRTPKRDVTRRSRSNEPAARPAPSPSGGSNFISIEEHHQAIAEAFLRGLQTRGERPTIYAVDGPTAEIFNFPNVNPNGKAAS